jgi:hypothetical protein
MKATMLYGPGDVMVENRPHSIILQPTDPSSASSAASREEPGSLQRPGASGLRQRKRCRAGEI